MTIINMGATMTEQRWKDVTSRKAQRYGKVGLQMELTLTDLLKKSVDVNGKPLFEEVTHHSQHSNEDKVGMDITVGRDINGVVEKRSFGVTTSLQRYNKTKNKHPNVKLFYTPVNFNPKNFISQVIALFSKKATE